jgi:hypothetical protein
VLSAHTIVTGLILLFIIASPPLAGSAPPVISLIEPYSTNRVLIHFDTVANRTYYLQYTDKLGTNGFATSTWSNLFKFDRTPDPNHYIYPDWRTNKMRFYRLLVTP